MHMTLQARLDDALKKIDSLNVFGSRPGLDRVERLLSIMGNPQDKLSFVHVAGTNGKGSVCTMLSCVLTAAGYRTGIFTSPHIVSFGERMRLNGKDIPDEDIVRLTDKLFPLVESLSAQGVVITEFEFVTAMAFEWFAEKQADIVILETGLGGRLDSTNVISTPLCSVITSISLDHTAVLGSTIEQIAAEKCGIIKPHGTTVYSLQGNEADAVVVHTAKRLDNVLALADAGTVRVLCSDLNGTLAEYGGGRVHIPLVGAHQVRNFALAARAVEVLRKGDFAISQDALSEGMEKVRMRARFEIIDPARYERAYSGEDSTQHSRPRCPTVIFDGAHNPDGMRSLSRAVDEYLHDRRIILVVGMLRDKDCAGALGYLKGKAHKVITTRVASSPRSRSAQELAQTARELFSDVTPVEDAREALSQAVRIAEGTPNSVVLCCGSLYMYGDMGLG